MSRIKMALALLLRGVGGLVTYAMETLNKALAAIDPAKKEKIQHALNVAEQVLSLLQAVKFLCPTRWQTAYAKSVSAVSSVVFALSDLTLTQDELTVICNDFNAACLAWNGDDDETCV